MFLLGSNKDAFLIQSCYFVVLCRSTLHFKEQAESIMGKTVPYIRVFCILHPHWVPSPLQFLPMDMMSNVDEFYSCLESEHILAPKGCI